jgi:ATP/maltotriose-dependent transcriptional regulator MalT
LQVLLSEQPDPGFGPGHADWTQCEGDYGVLLSEIHDLPPPHRVVLDAAAVVGVEFDVELVSQLLELSPAEVLDVVSVLAGRDLIRSRIRGQLYGFRHPVLQRAVYRGCRLSSRLALHSRLETIYRERGASILERAPHVAQSAKYGDLDAVELLSAAAQLVTPTDLSAAVGWLTTALRLLPAEPAMQDWRARLLVRLAEAKGSAGYLRECRDVMHQALRILPAEPADAHAEAVAYTGMVHRLLGRSLETESMLTAELAALDARPPAAGQLMLEIANVRLRAGDGAGSAEWARAALRIANEHGDPGNAATALGLLAMSVALAGQLGQAAQHLQQATAMLDRMLDDEFNHSLDAAMYISKAEMMLERWDDALRHQEKAVEFATRASPCLALPHLLVGQAHALQNTGRLAEAIAKIDEAVHLAQRSESPELLACVHAVRCSLYAACGRLDRVPESAAMAASYFRGNVRGWPGPFGARMLAEARLLNGDPEGCLALVSAVGGPELSAVEPISRVAWYELLTRAELATGRIDEAARWAARATKEAPVDLPGLQALASLARAQLLLVRDPQAALTDAEHAVRHFRLAGMTVEVLRARVILGIAMWHHRGYDEAARELRDTERGLEEAGALALARVARKERRRLAARGTRERGVDPHSITTCVLTSREQQVAELVGDGLTNRLIARRLNIAEKTVEMHMSKIFAKYGVASRAAVAAFVASRRAQEQAG